MITVSFVLVLGALIATIASAMGKTPLWVAVILLCVVEAINVLPLK